MTLASTMLSSNTSVVFTHNDGCTTGLTLYVRYTEYLIMNVRRSQGIEFAELQTALGISVEWRDAVSRRGLCTACRTYCVSCHCQLSSMAFVPCIPAWLQRQALSCYRSSWRCWCLCIVYSGLMTGSCDSSAGKLLLSLVPSHIHQIGLKQAAVTQTGQA